MNLPIFIHINSNNSKSGIFFCYKLDNWEINIVCKSLMEYYEMLNNLDTNLYNLPDKEYIDSFHGKYHLLKYRKNYKKFKELILKNNIYVELNDNDNTLPVKLITNQKIIIDTCKMNLHNLLTLLANNNFPENYKFIDRFNKDIELSYEEITNMYKSFNDLINIIKTNNLSPAEICQFLYDYVRKSIYTPEDKNDDYNESRNLLNVISGEKIVCVGYANKFCALANILGIHAERQEWYPTSYNKTGHASIIVYLNDQKYNLRGIYAFDPTWESKKNKDDQEYLEKSYLSFVPYIEELKIKKDKNLIERKYSTISILKNNFERRNILVNIKSPEIIIMNQDKLITKYLNTILDYLNIEKLKNADFHNKKNLQLLKSIIAFNNYIPINTFKEIIYNVKVFEKKYFPELAPGNININNIVINSQSNLIANEKFKALLKRIK